MRDISYRVALGGIVSALCLVLMFLAGIMPALYITLPMAAGALLMIIVTEVSAAWGFLTYLAVGILSMFMIADKEAALLFVMIVGHYPVVRSYIDKLSFKWLRTLLKLAVFNICAVSFYYITVYLFGIQQMMDEMKEFGKYGALILLIFCNFLFLLYDFLLDTLCIIYIKRMKPRFKRKN